MRFLMLLALAVNLPTGTTITVRLKTPISTKTAKAGDSFEAVALTGVPCAMVHGTVESARAAAHGARAQLARRFDDIGGQKISARLTAVDNARESIDDKGQINGILENETLTGRMDSGLQKLSGRFEKFASVLTTVKSAVLEAADTEIT